MPRAFRSSFSHWTTVRSFIEAFSTGTTSDSSPWVMTKPPTWMERWRGKPSIISARARVRCTPESSGRRPAWTTWASLSTEAPASSWCLASRST
jgi:hypothetical protein